MELEEAKEVVEFCAKTKGAIPGALSIVLVYVEASPFSAFYDGSVPRLQARSAAAANRLAAG